jgi:branched-chain amino acid transport system substrate-binding protein
MVMISPSATSPALSTVEDNGLFFRTAPSDARQGVVMSRIIMERGFESVAVTYTNNDYGKGLADSFAAAFEEMGGTVTLVAAMKTAGRLLGRSRRAGAAGGDVLVVAATSTRAAPASSRPRSTPAPSTPSCCPTAWSPEALVDNFGSDIDGSFGQNPGTDSEGAEIYRAWPKAAGFDGTLALLRRKLRRGGADPAGHAGGRLHRSGRLRGKDHGRRQRTGQPILPRRAWQGAGDDRSTARTSTMSALRPWN